MLYQSQNPHGGDLYNKIIKLDFSVNTNPLGTPFSVIHAVEQSACALSQYPDPCCRELGAAIAAHDGDPDAHPYIRALHSGLDARLSLMELMYNTDVSGNPFTATFESLAGLVATGVWNTALNRLEF